MLKSILKSMFQSKKTQVAALDIPVLIKPNSYIMMSRDIDSGSVDGNGTPNIRLYASEGTSVYRMPYSAVQFEKIENTCLQAMLIIDSDSILHKVTKLESET